MPYVHGFLRVGAPGHPDNALPGVEGPVDPGYGVGSERPDQGLPPPPVGVWPPPVPSHPIVPAPPGTPPGTIWPSPGVPSHPIQPPSPGAPDQGLPRPPPSPGRPDQGLPGQPGTPSHPIASQTYWMLCYCPSLGWTYVSVDPSLVPGHLPAAPPTAQPR
jgi:hypothetical protein